MIENTHFDRREFKTINIYNNIRGANGIGDTIYNGFLKCKLVHNEGFSVIVPDLIYVMDDEENFSWFQFYSFLPNHLTKFDDDILGTINVDIAWGHTLRLTIANSGHVTNFTDHSNLFKCRIHGPKNLNDYSTGRGKMIDGVPFIYLYHHTTPEIKALIEESKNYRGSLWNYQGTKTLESICYAYFTSLDSIRTPQDLIMIAMASDGEIPLMLDVSNEIIKIKVYRENTENRTATLKQLIDTTTLMNNHIWIHTHDNLGYAYYETCSPFIFRVGLTPATLLPFNGELIQRAENVQTNDHIVLGDSTTEIGLLAPFDEENTKQIFKIESFYNKDSNILKFWFDNNNKDLFTSKNITRPTFNRRQ